MLTRLKKLFFRKQKNSKTDESFPETTTTSWKKQIKDKDSTATIQVALFILKKLVKEEWALIEKETKLPVTCHMKKLRDQPLLQDDILYGDLFAALQKEFGDE